MRLSTRVRGLEESGLFLEGFYVEKDEDFVADEVVHFSGIGNSKVESFGIMDSSNRTHAE